MPNESSSVTTESPKKPVQADQTSLGDEEEEGTTMSEGIVTWTSDLSEEDEDKKATTEGEIFFEL